MATEHATAHEQGWTGETVTKAAIAGVVAGLVFGLLIQFRLERMQAIGAMYTLGSPSLSIGWIAHLVHSALFGAIFAILVGYGLAEYARKPTTAVPLAAAYGVALWALNIVFLWPAWLNGVGLGNAPPLPNVAVMPLVGHVVWGALLGLVYAGWQRSSAA